MTKKEKKKKLTKSTFLTDVLLPSTPNNSYDKMKNLLNNSILIIFRGPQSKVQSFLGIYRVEVLGLPPVKVSKSAGAQVP